MLHIRIIILWYILYCGRLLSQKFLLNNRLDLFLFPLHNPVVADIMQSRLECCYHISRKIGRFPWIWFLKIHWLNLLWRYCSTAKLLILLSLLRPFWLLSVPLFFLQYMIFLLFFLPRCGVRISDFPANCSNDILFSPLSLSSFSQSCLQINTKDSLSESLSGPAASAAACSSPFSFLLFYKLFLLAKSILLFSISHYSTIPKAWK